MALKDLSHKTIDRARGVVIDLARRIDTDAGDSPEPLRVGDLASRKIATVDSEASLAAVVRVLVDQNVGVVVVGDAARPSGIVSERDVIDAIYDGADLDAVWAADVMETDLVSVEGRLSADAAAVIMVDRGVRHLFVADPEPGMLSMRDLVAAQAHPVGP